MEEEDNTVNNLTNGSSKNFLIYNMNFPRLALDENSIYICRSNSNDFNSRVF